MIKMAITGNFLSLLDNHHNKMSEELKKEWRLLAEREDTFVYICDEKYHYEVPKNFIEFLLAKQQDTPMGVSEWMRIGKLHGYHDYWKDMTRIAVEEEFVKNIGMLRQWLNEDRKCEPMVTNDEIKHWLNI